MTGRAAGAPVWQVAGVAHTTDATSTLAPTAPAGTELLVRSAAPAAVTVRNDFVECLHHGIGAAVDASGTVASLGDPDVAVLPRSALKLMHAVAFLENGLDVPDELLAITCASHSGEPEHLQVVRRLLEHAGLDESHLQNTATLPLDDEAAFEWRSHGGEASSLTQNCSGDHAGMLATCVAAGWPTEGYLSAEHPVQQAIARTTHRLAGDLDDQVPVDGCGAPAFALSLTGLARAYGALAAAEHGSHEARVMAAVVAHPWLIGGSGRRNTRLMRALPGVAVKDGADGVIAAAVPGGGGVAVKVLDGADRARGVLLAEGLRALGVTVTAGTPGVTDPVLGHGEPVGEVVGLSWRRADRTPTA